MPPSGSVPTTKQKTRVVKTYTERLKEMKQSRPASAPSTRTMTLRGSIQNYIILIVMQFAAIVYVCSACWLIFHLPRFNSRNFQYSAALT